MIDNRTAPYGAFVLRVALGVFGLDGTTQFFVSLGLPAWTAPATILAEAVGGLAHKIDLIVAHDVTTPPAVAQPPRAPAEPV